jgi:hypothetical protein
MSHVIRAFENDPTTNNGLYITHHPHDWVLANHRYGLEGLNTEARASALSYAHQLGVEAPPTPVAAAAPVSASLPEPASVVAPHIVPEQVSPVAENITAGVAETLVVAGVGSGAVVGAAGAVTTAQAFVHGARFEAAHRAPVAAPTRPVASDIPEPRETPPEVAAELDSAVEITTPPTMLPDNTTTDSSLEPVLVEADFPVEVPKPPFPPDVVDNMHVDDLAARQALRRTREDKQDKAWENFMKDGENTEEDEAWPHGKPGRYKGLRRRKSSDKTAMAGSAPVEIPQTPKKEKPSIWNRMGRLLSRNRRQDDPADETSQPVIMLDSQNAPNNPSDPGLPQAA